jgi:quercetin dioxygenase-like cupin family protein
VNGSDADQAGFRVETWGEENALPPVDQLERWTIAGERSAVMRFRVEEGFVLPEHAHPEEQITVMLEGQLEFTVEDPGSGTIVTTAGAGDVVVIPGGVSHGARALTDVLSIDVFTPVRPELLPPGR